MNRPAPRPALLLLITCSLLLALLAGCGNKGDLVRPAPESRAALQ